MSGDISRDLITSLVCCYRLAMTRRQIMTDDHLCITCTVCMHAALIGGRDCETDFGDGVSSVSIGERASASMSLLPFIEFDRASLFFLLNMIFLAIE